MKNLLFYSILFLSFLSCKENSSAFFSLTVNVTPENAGFVTPSADTLLEDGSQILITAEAVEGYSFIGWTGALTSSENPLSIEITEDVEFTANFEIKTYALTIETVGNGQVTETVVQAKTDFDHGTLVRLGAVADTGWVFTGWSGDIESDLDVVEVLIESEMNIVANFEIQTFPLNISIEGNGSVFGVANETLNAEYIYGTELTLIGKPDSSWIFKRWSGDYTENSDTIKVVFTKEVNLSILFVEGAYLNIEIFGNGKVVPDYTALNTLFEKGTTVNLEAIPDTTWVFRGWNGDIVSEEKELEVTIDSDINLTMLFEEGVLDYCVPISLDGYRHKSDTDSSKIIDWDFKYDGRFLTSYDKRIERSKTGNFSLILHKGTMTYEEGKILSKHSILPVSDAKEIEEFTWINNELTEYTYILDSNNYSEFNSTSIVYEDECGLKSFAGFEHDGDGVEDGKWNLNYEYSNNCKTIKEEISSITIEYSDEGSIFKDLLGIEGFIGFSYEDLFARFHPIIMPNNEMKRLVSVEFQPYPPFVSTKAVETIEYFDHLVEIDYPKFFIRNTTYSGDDPNDRDSFNVKYYCGYK